MLIVPGCNKSLRSQTLYFVTGIPASVVPTVLEPACDKQCCEPDLLTAGAATFLYQPASPVGQTYKRADCIVSEEFCRSSSEGVGRR